MSNDVFPTDTQPYKRVYNRMAYVVEDFEFLLSLCTLYNMLAFPIPPCQYNLKVYRLLGK